MIIVVGKITQKHKIKKLKLQEVAPLVFTHYNCYLLNN